MCFTCQVTTLGYTAPWELAPLLDSTPLHTASFLNIGRLNNSDTPHVFVGSPRNSQSNFYVTYITDEQVGSAVSILTCIPEVPISNHSRDTDSPGLNKLFQEIYRVLSTNGQRLLPSTSFSPLLFTVVQVLLSNIYPTRRNVTQFIYIWKLLYMFRVVSPPIIRSTHNCIYSIWYLSNRYYYLPLSWKSWNEVPTIPR